jgi:hypothetical protein
MANLRTLFLLVAITALAHADEAQDELDKKLFKAVAKNDVKKVRAA